MAYVMLILFILIYFFKSYTNKEISRELKQAWNEENPKYARILQSQNYETNHWLLTQNLNSKLFNTEMKLSGCMPSKCYQERIESQLITDISQEDLEELEKKKIFNNKINEELQAFLHDRSNDYYYYPNTSIYRELATYIQEENQNVSLKIKIEPEVLYFISIEIGKKVMGEIKISNLEYFKEITISNVKRSSPNYVRVFSENPERKIKPNSELSIVIQYLPIAEGTHTMYLTFITDINITIVYKVIAHVKGKKLGFDSILLNQIEPNQIKNFPISIQNTENNTLLISNIIVRKSLNDAGGNPKVSLLSLKKDKSENSRLIPIKPGEFKTLDALQLEMDINQKYEGVLIIKIQNGENYFFPIIFVASKGSSFFRNQFDFGQFFLENLPRRVQLTYLNNSEINISSIVVPILPFIYYDFSPLFESNFFLNKTNNILGYATFYSEEIGKYESEIEIKFQNISSNISFKAEVLYEGGIEILYNDSRMIRNYINSKIDIIQKELSTHLNENSEIYLSSEASKSQSNKFHSNLMNKDINQFEEIFYTDDFLMSLKIKRLIPELLCSFIGQSISRNPYYIFENCMKLSHVKIEQIGYLEGSNPYYIFELEIYNGGFQTPLNVNLNISELEGENLKFQDLNASIENNLRDYAYINLTYNKFDSKKLNILISLDNQSLENHNMLNISKQYFFIIEWNINGLKWSSIFEISFSPIPWKIYPQIISINSSFTQEINEFNFEIISEFKEYPIQILHCFSSTPLSVIPDCYSNSIDDNLKIQKKILLNPLNIIGIKDSLLVRQEKNHLTSFDFFFMEQYLKSRKKLKLKLKNRYLKEYIIIQTNFIKKMMIKFNANIQFSQIIPESNKEINYNISKLKTIVKKNIEFVNPSKNELELSFFLSNKSPYEYENDIIYNFFLKMCNWNKTINKNLHIFCMNAQKFEKHKQPYSNIDQSKMHLIFQDLLNIIFEENHNYNNILMKFPIEIKSNDFHFEFTKYFIENRKLKLNPYESKKINLVNFNPNSIGMHQCFLYIKNNLTFLEYIKLVGISGIGKLEVFNYVESLPSSKILNNIYTLIEGSNISLLLEPDDLTEPAGIDFPLINLFGDMKNKYKYVEKILSFLMNENYYTLKNIIKKGLIFKNTGDLPLKIEGIYVNILSLSFENSAFNQTNFTLLPNESRIIEIQFPPDISRAMKTRSIIFRTDIGIIEYKFFIYIQSNTWGILRNRGICDLFDFFWKIIIGIISIIFGLAFFCISYSNYKNNSSLLHKTNFFKQEIFDKKVNLINKPTNLLKCLNSLMTYKKEKVTYKTLSLEKGKDTMIPTNILKMEDKISMQTSEEKSKQSRIQKKEEKGKINEENIATLRNQKNNPIIEEEKFARSKKREIDENYEEIRERSPSNETEDNLKGMKNAVIGEGSKEDSEEINSQSSKDRKTSSENQQTNYDFLDQPKEYSTNNNASNDSFNQKELHQSPPQKGLNNPIFVKNSNKNKQIEDFKSKKNIQNIEKQLPSSIKDLFSDDEESDNMYLKEENKGKKTQADINKSIPSSLLNQNFQEENEDDAISSFFKDQEKNEKEKFLSIKKFWEDSSELPSSQFKNYQEENPQEYLYEPNYFQGQNFPAYEDQQFYTYNNIQNPQNSSYFSSIPDSQIKESLMFPKFLNPEYENN